MTFCKKIVLICFLCIFSLVVFAQSYKRIDMDIVNVFEVSDSKAAIGLNFKQDYPNGPISFAFSKIGELFVCDAVNLRLIKMDTNFENFQYYHDVFSNYKQVIEVNNNNEILSPLEYTFSVDSNLFEKKVNLRIDKSSYSSNFPKKADFIYYDDTVFTYLKDNSLICVQDPGISYEENNNNILSPEETKELLNSKYLDEILVTDSNHILINGELRTRNFSRFFSYWNEYYDGARDKLSLTGKLFGENSANSMRYIGRDQDENWYWDFGKYAIVVYNSKGQVIENFLYNSRKSKTLPTVHPSGDVYVMDYDEEGIYLYKISRQW